MKLDEMLSIQKSTSNRTSLGYGFSSYNIASTNTTVFVPPSNNVEIENNDVKTDLASENIDKGKSILEAPPKQDKKEVKNPRGKKANFQKPKQKKQHLCHHCGVVSRILSQSSFYALLCLTCFCLFLVFFFFNFFYIKINKKLKNQKNTKIMCFVYIGTCVLWMAIEKKFSKLCIFCSLDEYLYA